MVARVPKRRNTFRNTRSVPRISRPLIVVVDLRLFISGCNKWTKDYSDYSTLGRASKSKGPIQSFNLNLINSIVLEFQCFRIVRKNACFKKFEAGQGARDFSRRDDPEIVALDTFILSLEEKKKKGKQWLSFKK